jgi:CRP-like cAMP-binding protein
MIAIMSDDFVEQLIAKARRRRLLDRGSYLFHQGAPVRAVFVIEAGLVELTRHHRDGASIVVQRATGRTILAEASAYSATYHCDAVVVSPSSVFALPKAAFLEHLRNDAAFANLWAAHLAREVQSARYRSEILTRKTVAERLDGWLAWRANELPSKGQWKRIAVQIGVSPEALYRELAKRRSG